LVEVFELERILEKRTGEVSKGELQRTILAFSLLYGSPIVMMDEPVFAMEDGQKRRAFEFLVDYATRNEVSIYYSVHELELSQEYSEHVLLFSKLGPPELGTTEEIMVREKVEEAYQVPFTMLKQRERLYRKTLIQISKARRG
jgi:ABC-type cobalamin/Fe3+-siderophores transport system ATPase subunit